MLYGEYRCTLDEKGRVNFPARFRDEMGDTFFVTRWLDDCLVAFPAEEWERIANQMAEKNTVKSRGTRRLLYSGAAEAVPDKQGRILLPQHLRQHAGLQKDVVVIGVGSHAEIWDAAAWKDMNESLSGNALEAAMEELDF